MGKNTTPETANMNPILTVRRQFKSIVKQAKKVYAKSNAEDKNYWKEYEKVTYTLRLFLYNDLKELSKNDILILCSLVLRHQPLAFHSFLRQLGNMAVNAPQID